MTPIDVLFFASVAGLALGVFAIVWYRLRRTQAVPATLTMPIVRYNPDTVVSEVSQRMLREGLSVSVHEDSNAVLLAEKEGENTPNNLIDFSAVLARCRAAGEETESVHSTQVAVAQRPIPAVTYEADKRVAPGGTIMVGRPAIILVDPPPTESKSGR